MCDKFFKVNWFSVNILSYLFKMPLFLINNFSFQGRLIILPVKRDNFNCVFSFN